MAGRVAHIWQHHHKWVPHLRRGLIATKVGHFRGSENPVTLTAPTPFRDETQSSNWSSQK
jgi:hypothetical protein